EHEIELAKAYIAIEKARFGNRLDVDFHIKGDIYNLKVPILVLQPIIENAIIHGVLPKAEGGTVDIQISREGKTLFFSVKDNGVGMDKAKLENILAGYTNHIGLSNIDSRLRRLYKQGLEMTSKEDEGTEIKWCTYI
uniref:sensor histidine kinase n=1 Tax=Anaerotignum sp. TaxID=2039241 RepID=UPI00289B5BA4